MENYSLADISAVTGKDTNALGGGGSGLWVFALRTREETPVFQRFNHLVSHHVSHTHFFCCIHNSRIVRMCIYVCCQPDVRMSH